MAIRKDSSSVKCVSLSFSDGLGETAQALLSSKGKKSKGKGQDSAANHEPPADAIKVILHFKRYMYDPQKRMLQR